MKIYYYNDVPNFGDMLNKYIWPHFFGSLLERKDNVMLFGIGTLIGNKVKHNGPIIVFGSGCGYISDLRHVQDNQQTINFVRGPMSAKVLGLSADYAITDPAILTPEVFPASAPRGDVVFVPHWETSFNPLWKRACELAGVTYIDPLADVKDVAAGISGARLVIAEAMHAAILADAYRVPWVPVSTSPRINEFKWNDWARSLNVKLPAFSYFRSIGASDYFRAIMFDCNQTYVELLSHKKDGKTPFLKKLYKKMVSYKWRCRIEHRLLTKTGPGLDIMIDKIVGKGYYCPSYIQRAADQIKRLSLSDGALSEQSIADEKRQKIHDRIYNLKIFLEGSRTKKSVA